jgi:hypothetical protein
VVQNGKRRELVGRRARTHIDDRAARHRGVHIGDVICQPIAVDPEENGVHPSALFFIEIGIGWAAGRIGTCVWRIEVVAGQHAIGGSAGR